MVMDRLPFSRLTDSMGRIIRYVRISVTDRCNLRCQYCRSGFETFISHDDILRYEEIEQLVELVVALGVEKIRLTGGEPFVRRGFLDFLERIRNRHPLLDIRLTSNGTLLGPQVVRLKELGINSVNLSLDTFDREKFEMLTGQDLLPAVLGSMEELLKAGVPFKVNAVAMRGINDDELPCFLDYALKYPVEVRFIEFMPMSGVHWSREQFWSGEDILSSIRRYCPDVEPLEGSRETGESARLYGLRNRKGEQGRFGLITPLSSHFCAFCNRLRFTAEGNLRTCLYDGREYRLREILRHPRLGVKGVQRVLERAVLRKPLGSQLLERRTMGNRRMNAIGG